MKYYILGKLVLFAFCTIITVPIGILVTLAGVDMASYVLNAAERLITELYEADGLSKEQYEECLVTLHQND